MRKVCRRKVWAKIDPIAHAIAGVRPTSEADRAALHIRELSALDAMTHGRGGLQEWHDLTAVLNLCEAAALTVIGPEALPSCKAAQEALMDAARRFEATGRMGLTATGIQALRDVIEYHDMQRRSISRSEYEGVIRKARKQINNSVELA